MNMKQFKNKVNSNKNRNTRFVKIRTDHICKACGKVLRTGTNCLTTNKQGEGRQWYCNKCVATMLSNNHNDGINRQCNLYRCIMSTKVDLDNVAFGDEGASLAYMDALSEYEDKCLDCGKCTFAEMIYNN